MEEKLNAPRDFLRSAGVTPPSSTALLTPSHFVVSSVSAPAVAPPILPPASVSSAGGMVRTQPPDPQVVITHSHQENQRLTLSPDPRREEREQLRVEVERLKEELKQRDRLISRQRAEREELWVELLSCKEELKRSREQVRERHSVEISTLTQTNTHLQETLTAVKHELTSLRQRVEEVTSERERLQEQLSTQSGVIAEQADTLQKLRSYIGTHSGEEEQHTLVQKLQKEKEALCVSVELLKVRVQAANDILTLQERELRDQGDPLQKDRAAGRLLSLWREKVFLLLVQLRSRDLQLHTEKSQLHTTVCDLEQDVQKLQSQICVVQHNLQDRTAELELQNIHTQELQERLCSAMEENKKLKEQKEECGRWLRDLTDTAHRVNECVEQCGGQVDEAQCRMNSLSQRLTFATKRLDTVQGLLLRREALRKAQKATKPPEPPASQSCIERLQAEVALLSSERDTLTQELKRTPELIQNALSDLQDQLEKEVGLLTQALSQSKTELDECELRREEAQRQCKEQEGTIAELRAEAHHIQQHCEQQEGTIAELHSEAHRMQQHWQSLLQEKVSEAESVCEKQLREMEAQLNTARREHTKAVVALRQVERTAAREREQEREAERARSDHTHQHITHLHTQLRNKDKDRSILLAVVQQQGLMSEYRRVRRAAIQTPKALLEQQHKKQQQQQQQHEQQQSQSGDTQQRTGDMLSMLGEVRSLSSALVHSSEEEEEEEEGQGDHTLTARLTV